MDLSSGYMCTGFQQIDGKWYFFKPSGLMATGWVNTDDKWYYMLDDGTMVTGWLKIDRGNNNVDYYFMKGDGSMLSLIHIFMEPTTAATSASRRASPPSCSTVPTTRSRRTLRRPKSW